MYLTYSEYQAMTGKTLDSATEFERLEYKARKIVDAYTFNRLVNETPTREAVKRLMCELVDMVNAQSANAEQVNSGVASYSNDGVSISYTTGEAAQNAQRERLQTVVYEYLSTETTADGTPLTSRWVYAP